MSGYNIDDAIVHHGLLNDGVIFIKKPFSPVLLAETVRKVPDEN